MNNKSSVADPHHLDADPDPAFHLDADPDPTFQFDADPDPANILHIKAHSQQTVLTQVHGLFI